MFVINQNPPLPTPSILDDPACRPDFSFSFPFPSVPPSASRDPVSHRSQFVAMFSTQKTSNDSNSYSYTLLLHMPLYPLHIIPIKPIDPSRSGMPRNTNKHNLGVLEWTFRPIIAIMEIMSGRSTTLPFSQCLFHE